jgi:sodium transport system permease protein
MRIANVFTVFMKEVLDIIRDRRTLIFMILLPLLAIPVLMTIIQGLMIDSQKNIAASSSVIAVIGEADAPELVDFLQTKHKEQFEPTEDETVNAFMLESRSGVNAFLNIKLDIEDEAKAQELLRQKEIDAVLVVPPGFSQAVKDQYKQEEELESGTAISVSADIPKLRIDHISTNDHSDKAYDRLRDSLRKYNEEIVAGRLSQAGLYESFIEPVDIEGSDLATQQEKMGEIFGRFLPYLIILMTFAGATFPAIQLGAGEKEQKTLETLLVSPVGRMEMVLGKFLTIVLTGMISAILSLVGMYYSFKITGESAGLADILTMQLDITSMIFAVLLILPLALIFAALLLSLSVMAKSFREAQSYVGPLNMVIILPAFASFLPGVELNTWLSMVPVVNVSLVLRNIMAGKLMEIMPYYGIAMASTFILAAIAIVFCAAMFKREQVVFNT